jgi:hypothetical protein
MLIQKRYPLGFSSPSSGFGDVSYDSGTLFLQLTGTFDFIHPSKMLRAE